MANQFRAVEQMFKIIEEEQETFAGRLREELSGIVVHNSSMIGYNTHDYKAVIEHFLPGRDEVRGVVLVLFRVAFFAAALFARLEHPIDFDSIDEQPVDLICVLLAPETAGADHLKALARVSRLLRDQNVCEKIRGSDKAEAIHALLTNSTASHAA